MRQPLVAGNWKMNTTLQTARKLASEIAAKTPLDGPVEVLVCPPFPYLEAVADVITGSGVKLGAQNSSAEDPGAFTGEIAVEMLLDLGCKYVILGHSERRHILGESSAFIGKKVAAALRKGLQVVLCVGEQLSEREAGQTESVLDEQMEGGLRDIDIQDPGRLVIAYEPVWAIGTGVTAKPEQAESAHDYLRKWLANRYNPGLADGIRILYGGSVKPDNAQTLLALPNVDGALVGGASLKADDFLKIVAAGG